MLVLASLVLVLVGLVLVLVLVLACPSLLTSLVKSILIVFSPL